MTITKVDASTRPAAGADKVTTHISINWEGMTEQDLIGLAQQTIIIRMQAAFRKADAGIPSTAEVLATDYKVGKRAPKAPVDVLELAKKMSPEQLANLKAQLAQLA